MLYIGTLNVIPGYLCIIRSVSQIEKRIFFGGGVKNLKQYKCYYLKKLFAGTPLKHFPQKSKSVSEEKYYF